MSGIQRSEAEKNNRNRYIEAMGQKLTANTARMQKEKKQDTHKYLIEKPQ